MKISMKILHYEAFLDASFVTDIITTYLNIPDVVLSVFENTSVHVDDFVLLLYQNDVFASVFEWKELYERADDLQFLNFIHVVSSGRQSTIVFFLDAKSTNIFLNHLHKIRDTLVNPCFYRWIFFDLFEINIELLNRYESSTVCWRTIFVKEKNEQGSYSRSLSLIGPSVTKDGGCILNEYLGEWSSSTSFPDLRAPDRLIEDFKNGLYTVSLLNEQPFYAPLEDGSAEGLEFELINTLKEKLNFRVKVVENDDGEFGRKLPNGTWTGFIGLITSGKTIFSIATLSISNRRMQAVDFSSPYLFGKMAFAVLNPALESRKYVLIKPLSPPVWTGLVSTFLVCTCTLYLITHSLPCKTGVRRSYNVWFLLRTLGQQGTPSPAPARLSIRILIGGWWFFIMVILWSYAGTLTSFMTYPGRRQTVDTVSKLQNALNSRSFRYGTIKGTTYENFLMGEMSEMDPVFGKRLLENPEYLVHGVPEGMDLVLKGGYAFVYLRFVLKWYAAVMGVERFRQSKNVFLTEAIGIALQKCHPCKMSFDHIVNRLEEAGVFGKWYDDAIIKARIRAAPSHLLRVRPLSLNDLQGAFYFLGICLSVAAAILGLEITSTVILCFRKRYSKKKRHDNGKCRYHSKDKFSRGINFR